MDDERAPDSSPRWMLGIAATLVAGLLLGGWASTSSGVADAAKRIAALEATTTAAERRVSGIEAQLVRIEAKLDRALERK